MEEKRRIVLLLRWVLVIALSYLVVFSARRGLELPGLSVAALLLSNLVLMRLPEWVFKHRAFDLVLVGVDVLLISVTLHLCGGVDPDLFFVLLFVVFLASLGDRVEVSAIGACFAGAAYLFFVSRNVNVLDAGVLLRVPFFFVAALTYGYLASTARDARLRAQTAEHLLEAKTNFLASVSHEIRTPLHVLVGYGAMLEDGHFGPLSESQRDGVSKIVQRANELRMLIDRTLTAARLESGRMPVYVHEVDLAELLDEIREGALPYRREGVALEITVAPDASMLTTDRLKVKEVVTNLVTNALKYTQAGRVSVDVHRAGGAPGVEVVVADTGIGISPENHASIFEPFARAADADRSETIGVGLGLYIVRRLLDVLHGEITVRSVLGQGATFVVRLPPLAEDAPVAARAA